MDELLLVHDGHCDEMFFNSVVSGRHSPRAGRSVYQTISVGRRSVYKIQLRWEWELVLRPLPTSGGACIQTSSDVWRSVYSGLFRGLEVLVSGLL